MGLSNFSESKVVYREGNQIRAIRGILSIEGDFYVVKRRAETVRIPKSAVVKISERRDGGR